MTITRVSRLKTFALIVSVHPYCASKFTCHVMHLACALGQMAIVITLPEFNNLGRLMTHIFLLMANFLYRFSTISEKNEENLLIKSFMFLQNAPSGSVFLPLRLSVRQFQMPLERLSFVKTLTKFGIVYSTDPLLPLPPLPPKFASVDSPSVF